MNSARFMLIVVSVLVLLALIGMPLAFGGMGTAECPFMPGEMVMCASALAHIGHWHTALSAALFQLLLASALVGIAALFVLRSTGAQFAVQRLRYAHTATRAPTLLQVLFARGILHRKEGCGF